MKYYVINNDVMVNYVIANYLMSYDVTINSISFRHMNKCEIEDCELCAPLKGKYYHHAYENAKNVRFCNSNPIPNSKKVAFL